MSSILERVARDYPTVDRSNLFARCDQCGVEGINSYYQQLPDGFAQEVGLPWIALNVVSRPGEASAKTKYCRQCDPHPEDRGNR